MNRTFTRFVAAAVAGGALALTGAGLAQAERATPTVTEQSPTQRVHDLTLRLAHAAQVGDLAGVKSAVDQLRPALAQVTPTERASGQLARIDEQARLLQRALPGLPPLPGVGGLLPSLLAALQQLLAGLLGGIPIPIPIPEIPIPELPVPELPGVPGVPGLPLR